jgi:hypothetical protein
VSGKDAGGPSEGPTCNGAWQRSDDARITVAPIISIPAKDTQLAAINHHLRAVAIVSDFVNPVLALWRLFNRDDPSSSSVFISPSVFILWV